jgi:hypothetical protein
LPLDTAIFPQEIQEMFLLFSCLSDRWDLSTGTYLGKDWTSIDYFMSLYNIAQPSIIFYFLKLYDNLIIEQRMKESDKRRKAEERKRASASSGNTFAHSVRG